MMIVIKVARVCADEGVLGMGGETESGGGERINIHARLPGKSSHCEAVCCRVSLLGREVPLGWLCVCLRGREGERERERQDRGGEKKRMKKKKETSDRKGKGEPPPASRACRVHGSLEDNGV